MSGFLNGLLALYNEQVKRHRNRGFLKATMAACAMTAVANGSVTFRERVKLDQIMETLEALKVFDPHEGVDLFNEFVEGIQTTPEEGRIKAMETIREEISQDPEKATLLIRLCLAVCELDGKVPLTEQIEIVGLCNSIGVDPTQFDLYAADPSRLTELPE